MTTTDHSSLVLKALYAINQREGFDRDILLRVGPIEVEGFIYNEWGAAIDRDEIEDVFVDYDNSDFGHVIYGDQAYYLVSSMRALREILGKTRKAGAATVKNKTRVLTKITYSPDEAVAERQRIYGLAEKEEWSAGSLRAYLAHLNRRTAQGA